MVDFPLCGLKKCECELLRAVVCMFEKLQLEINMFYFFGSPPPNSIDFTKEKKRDKFGPKLSRKENPSRCLVRNALDAANGVWIGANVLA